ncbi:hypothetical protein E2C01_073692 [Portunus trituberculatus]|uniref:Uncharacterized protein n=1 Tax=Portunus trituberculatus TaxID=210409 RepID=A0A5B7IE76_PORTR|nr:hypothetical protein [Portunus trituberculatus]
MERLREDSASEPRINSILAEHLQGSAQGGGVAAVLGQSGERSRRVGRPKEGQTRAGTRGWG